MIGEMANASRQRLEAMNVEQVAKHYGIPAHIVAAYRALAMGVGK